MYALHVISYISSDPQIFNPFKLLNKNRKKAGRHGVTLFCDITV